MMNRLSACLPVCLSACLTILQVDQAWADAIRPINATVDGWTYTPVESNGDVNVLVALKNYDQLPAGVIGLYAKKTGR